jgi:hypothetical protein
MSEFSPSPHTITQIFSVASVLKRGHKLPSKEERSSKMALFESRVRQLAEEVEFAILRRLLTTSEDNLSEWKLAGGKRFGLLKHLQLSTLPNLEKVLYFLLSSYLALQKGKRRK